jgi:ABC-type Fe3+-hydroxamate transport system substrate-binding protein
MKIISLVPSITETLFDFGLSEMEIVGRTKFCIHPKEKVQLVEIIGGTKNINIEKIKTINPDLIIANKEENVKEQVEELMKYFPVWLTEIDTLEDNYQFLMELGEKIYSENTAEIWIDKLKQIFNFHKANSHISYTYLIWKNPYMTIGNDTFIHSILQNFGFENTHQNKQRYPEIALEDMQSSDIIFLSTEPFPFQQKHIEEFQQSFPNKKIMLVDGEAFSWYGTHLAKCKKYYLEFLQETK